MMFTRKASIILLALAASITSASAGPIVYVVNGAQQFGTIDVATGAFQQLGPAGAEPGYFGLAPGANGSLVTFSYSSNLYSINPVTGVQTLVGATGLDDCATVHSSCGPTSASTLGGLNGNIYATDFRNNLYSLNPVSGAATLIGLTGIPGIPFVPGSQNPDGTFNLYDQTLFGAGGKLYSTFDVFVFDFGTFTITDPIVAPALYEINPSTGHATLVGPTDWNIGGVFSLNGTPYAFDLSTSQIVSLNVTTGNTSFVGNFDPAAGVIQGAVAATPESCSMALAGIGITAIVVSGLRRHGSIASVIRSR